MLDILQDRLGHLLYRQGAHQMEWSDDTVQNGHISRLKKKEESRR